MYSSVDKVLNPMASKQWIFRDPMIVRMKAIYGPIVETTIQLKIVIVRTIALNPTSNLFGTQINQLQIFASIWKKYDPY